MSQLAVLSVGCSLARIARRAFASGSFQAFGGLVVSALVATSAAATEDLWWMAHGSDTRWNTESNWILSSPPHPYTIPDGTLPTFITTSEDPGLTGLPSVIIDETLVGDEKARTAGLYVGGWGPYYDAKHGDPAGHSGVVEITGGELDVAEHYVRIGTGGATGTVNQSGGTLSSSGAIDLAWKSTDSLGIYNLSGGTIATWFLNIGTQGRGEFEMTGGSVLGQTLVVGMAFLSVPSVGVMNQTGGTVDVKNLKVGHREAAVGSLFLQDDAVILASQSIQVGMDGYGSVVQSGGMVEVRGVLYLGVSPTGVGKYTIQGGTLSQIGPRRHAGKGLHVGLDGVGELTVIGSAAVIDISGAYEQNADSLLTFRLDDSQDHITTIAVGGPATFAPGARLRIELAEGYEPQVNETFVLLTAGEGVIDGGLTIVESEGWSVDTTTGGSVTATYAAIVAASVPSLSPFGIALLSSLMGLAVWRRLRSARA